MCIAILNTKGTTLKKKLLSNCWENNGDGAGILYIDDDSNLQTFKTLDSFEEFYANYIEIKKSYGKSRNMLLHFRISTHGVINKENCHPFIVDESVGFIHNGMISNVPDSVQYSDTNMLNRTLLQKLKTGFEQDDEVLEFLDSLIGSGNKLVFLNNKDEWSIVNEAAGHWKYKCWFSNDSYKEVHDWYDFGGVKKKKKKGSRVGFTPAYSYKNYYDSKYDPYYDDFGTANECKGCGLKLYGMNELNRGTCDFCHRDEKDEKKVTSCASKLKNRYSTCDACNWHDGEYRYEWSAHICDECYDSINGELGA